MTTEQQTSDESAKFVSDAGGFFAGGIKGYTSVNSLLATVHDQVTGLCIPMHVSEARALRDWLNKVLP